MATDHAWSTQQERVFHFFAKDGAYFLPDLVDVDGNLVVDSKAGVGKTTTALKAIDYAPERNIMLCAFNKRIAEELGRRLTNPCAQAKTLHAIGFAAVTRYWERLRVASGNDRADSLTQAVCGSFVPDPIKRLISKLHTKGREILPLADKPGDLLALAEQFDCEPDAEWDTTEFDTAFVEAKALEAMVLAAAEKPLRTGIDFADMVYLPIRNKWLRPTYDLVIVDECQDMSAAQIITAKSIAAGRIVVFGDSRQAVYGFRGADSDSLDRLKVELHASVLSLNTTYRCGKHIVKHANRVVPDFFAHESAHDGEIRRLTGVAAVVKEAAAGDFVLSRKNAPLAGVAMAFLRAHKRVVVSGRDIGAGLISLVDKLTKGHAGRSVPLFLQKLQTWKEKEITRAVAKNQPEKIATIEDRAETLEVLTEGVVSVEELKTRLAGLFTDTSDPATVITCSSIHKAKGLEADRVYVLVDTLYPKLPKGVIMTPARMKEEANLDYVATTRARHTLVLVNGEAAPTALKRLSLDDTAPMAEAVNEQMPATD